MKMNSNYLGGFSSTDRYTQPGREQARALKDGASFTTQPRNWGTGGDPILKPSGATTGGLPTNSGGRDAGLARVARGAVGNLAASSGKLSDAVSAGEWANPYAKPSDLGAPSAPPLVQATPVGNPDDWANPFPDRSDPYAGAREAAKQKRISQPLTKSSPPPADYTLGGPLLYVGIALAVLAVLS